MHTWGKLIMRTGISDSINLRGSQPLAVSTSLSRKQETADRKEEVLPVAHLYRLYVKVWPQDVDVSVQVEGFGGLTLAHLPHLNASHR